MRASEKCPNARELILLAIFSKYLEPFPHPKGYIDIITKGRYSMRMQHKPIIMAIAAFALAMSVSAAAFAQPHHGKGDCPCMKKGAPGQGPMFFGNPAVFKQELGLTDQQIAKIENINTEHHKKMLEWREKLEPKHIQLERLLLENNVNLNSVRSVLREIADMRIEIDMLKIAQRLEIEKVLTAEQKTKLRAMRQHPKMGPGMRHHGPDEF
jgi:Spy/CpxP family protein refolding chaperone